MVTLTLTFDDFGSAGGTVFSSPSGIACQFNPCHAQFACGASVTLTATPSRPYGFGGWSGPCSGLGDCVVQMSTDTTVTVAFAPYNLAFVTASKVVPGMLGGVDGGDGFCNTEAANAYLPGHYLAYLSTSAQPAAARFPSTARGWALPTNDPVADQMSGIGSLSGGNIFDTIQVDQNGAPEFGVVATGTSGDGLSAANCGDWTQPDAGNAVGGVMQNGGPEWQDSALVACDLPQSLYCFGIDYDVPLLPVVPDGGRLAFVSSAVALDGGLGQADSQCQSDANDAGLPGTYLALLPTLAASAASRFVADAGAWYRVDGIALSPTASDLLNHRLVAAFDLTANGTRYDYTVLTGEQSPSNVGFGSDTCGDWTFDGGSTYAGDTYSTSGWFGSFTMNCAVQMPLYCLQE
jgi:hypothetical protein